LNSIVCITFFLVGIGSFIRFFLLTLSGFYFLRQFIGLVVGRKIGYHIIHRDILAVGLGNLLGGKKIGCFIVRVLGI
jgi:hypothetical protein